MTSARIFTVTFAFFLAACGGGGSPKKPDGPDAPNRHAVSVTVTGSGSVSSAPAGVSCGQDCTESFESGTAVTLTAAPMSGHVLQAWSGACAGSSLSCTISVTTAQQVTATFVQSSPPSDTQAPSPPAGLSAQASSDRVSLSWMSSTDNVGVSAYEIFRDGSETPLGQSVVPTYIDTSVSANVTYSYRVRALDAAGNQSGFSNTVSVTVGNPSGGIAPGWQVTAANTGLTPHGLNCDSLPVYAGSAKPASGTTISGKLIRTTLDLSAGNITIERSCIRPTTIGRGTSVVVTTDFNSCNGDRCAVTPAMVAIRDSEIDGSLLGTEAVAKSCAFLGVGSLERNYIHDVGSGICFMNTGDQLNAIAIGNYVHRLRSYGDPAGDGSHNESFTIRDFVTTANPNRRARVLGNRFDSSSGNDSGALFIQTYAGNIDMLQIEANLLEGGGYQLVLEAHSGNVYGRNMRAVNNRFSGSGYGPAYVDGKGLNYGWLEWRDNYINDPTQPANKGRLIPDPSP